MELSFFSFLMAVVWSGIFFCLLTFVQRDIRLIRHFGVTAIFILYIGCILRFLFPVEFFFTRVVSSSVIYTAVYKALCLDQMRIASWRVSVMAILTVFSSMVTVILTVRFSGRYFLFHRMTSFSGNMSPAEKQQLARVLNRLQRCPRYDRRIRISYSFRVSVPAGIGLWKRKILLPHFKYTDTELYYILLHEFTHFANKDLFIKMAAAFLRNIFWWNPFIHLLQRNLDELLEIRCDLRVVSGMCNREKADYLSAIVSSLEKTSDISPPLHHLPNACLMDARKKKLLKKRFLLTASYGSTECTYRTGIFRSVYIFFAALILIGSYSFILQPRYTAPEEEIVTEPDIYIMTPDNTFLFMDENGRYSISGPHVTMDNITDETVQMMIQEGFQIKELNENEENSKTTLYGMHAYRTGAVFLCECQCPYCKQQYFRNHTAQSQRYRLQV